MRERFVRICRLSDAAAMSRQLSRNPGEEWIFSGDPELGRLCAVTIPPLVQITIDSQLTRRRDVDGKRIEQAVLLVEAAAA